MEENRFTTDKKPVLQLNNNGEMLDLDFIIGAVHATGSKPRQTRVLVTGEMGVDDLLNGMAHTITAVMEALYHISEDGNATLEIVTEAVKDGIRRGAKSIAGEERK